MSQTVTLDGDTFIIPDVNDSDWGSNVTDFLVAIPSSVLQHTGGSFYLTSSTDFGPTAGILVTSLSSRGSSPSTAGLVRLSNSDSMGWRNAANTGNLLLGVNASDQLTFDGDPLEGAIASVADTSTIDLSISSLVLSASIIAGSIANSHISSSAAIARSKIATGDTNTLVYNDSSGNLADVTAITANRALISDSNGLPSSSSVTNTELGYVSGVTSAIQTQLNNKLSLAGGTLTGALTLPSDPSSSLQAATKQYVDSVAQGLQVKDAVITATTSAGTLASDFDNGSTVGGVQVQTGDRIIIKNQADETENGFYVVESAGTPTRSTDADT